MPHPISLHMRNIFSIFRLLNFYKEDTSLQGNSRLLQHVIHHWDHARQEFKVGFDSWYHAIEEDIYFITGLSRMGEDWPQFLELLHHIVAKTQLIYVQRYVSPDIEEPTYL